MKHWYLPTLLVFLLAASVAGVDYAMEHWQTATFWSIGTVAGFVLVCIMIGTGQGLWTAWKDARETDRVLKGGRG